MPKNFDARNPNQAAPPKPPCPGCGGSGFVRVSRPVDAHRSPARQTYDIVTEPCPDCR